LLESVSKIGGTITIQTRQKALYYFTTSRHS